MQRSRVGVGGVLATLGLCAVAACGPERSPDPTAASDPVSHAPTFVPTATRTCPPGAVPVSVELPERTDITVNVYNGTSRPGLGTEVAQELRTRGFHVARVAASDDPSAESVLRYGPDGLGAAWLLRAYFPGARVDFDPGRRGATVDVIVGANFVNVPTTTEINQGIARLGQPVAPPGTCPV